MTLELDTRQIGMVIAAALAFEFLISLVVYVLLSRLIKNTVAARIPQVVSDDIDARIAIHTAKAVNERMDEVKSHVADVRELVRKITDIQQDLVAATQAIAIVGEKFENMHVCPYGTVHECKLQNS